MSRTFVSQKNNNAGLSCCKCKQFSSVYDELIKAVEQNDVDTVSHILNCSYDLNTNKQGNAQTLIHKAFTEPTDGNRTQRQITEMLELLLDKGVSINARDSKEQTVLHLAIEGRKTQVIDFLIERQANLHVRDSIGNTLAHHLIESEFRMCNDCICSPDPRGKLRPSQKESADFIQYMILKGLNVDHQNKNGYTALHLAANYNLLHALSVLLKYAKNVKLCNNREMTAFQVFVENVTQKIQKMTPLDALARRLYEGRYPDRAHTAMPICIPLSNYSTVFIDEIFLKFMSNGFSANFTDRLGSTPVHYALKMDRPKIVNSMLKEFVNLHARDEDGNTVLHAVIDHLCRDKCEFMQEYKEIARELWSKGADIYTLNKRGLSPLSVAVKSGKPFLLSMFVEYGATFNRRRSQTNLLLKFFLIRKTTEKNTASDQTVLLDRQQCYSKKIERVEKDEEVFDQLIKQGWEVNSKDSHGTTLLHVAAQLKDKGEDLIGKLIKRGAHVDVADDDGCLPLHTAIFNKNFQATKSLLMFGADINVNTHLLDVDTLKSLPVSVYLERFRNAAPEGTESLLNRHKDESVSFFILEYLITLQVAELPIDDKLKSILPSDRKNYSWIYQQCSREIRSLKGYKIINNLSIYDLLHANRNSTSRFEINEKLKKLSSCTRKLEKWFPLYHVLISGVCHIGIAREEMIEPAKDALTNLTNNRLPELCLYEIFRFLNNVNLRSLIQAAKDSK